MSENEAPDPRGNGKSGSESGIASSSPNGQQCSGSADGINSPDLKSQAGALCFGPHASVAGLSKDSGTFQAFWDKGYRRLIPIIPPNAAVCPNSHLARRTAAGKDPRGKMPGLRWPDGYWRGFDWTKNEAEEQGIAQWAAMGASVGIKTGQGVVAIDADLRDLDLAKLVADEIERRFGAVPTRIGNAPKALYVLRCSDPDIGYMSFGVGVEGDRVELLAEGRQFVASGMHSKTGKPYRWERALPKLSDLPIHSASDIVQFLEDLRAKLPGAGKLTSSKAKATNVDQAALKGDIEWVRKAIEALPNDANFQARADWVRVAYAIKAATQGDDAEGLEIFHEWSSRWTEGHNDAENVDDLWRSLKPPYEIGAPWLYRKAEELSGGKFSWAQMWWEPPDIAPSLNDLDGGSKPNERPSCDRDKLSLTSWLALDLPPRENFLGDVLGRGSKWLISGQTGVGKTNFGAMLAGAVASGSDFLAWKSDRKRRRVMYIDGEMNARALKARLENVAKVYGSDLALFGYNRGRAEAGRMPPLDREEGYRWLIGEVGALKPDLVIFDSIRFLTVGNIVDEETWTQVLRIVEFLVRRDIAQIWMHHTGHDKSRAYGSSTIAWGME